MRMYLRHVKNATISVALTLALSGIALGQNSVQLSKTACKQWDDAYLSIVNASFIGCLLLIVISSFLLVNFFRSWWWATRPWLRGAIISFSAFVLVLVICLGLPSAFGYGALGLNPNYPDCSGMRFGATGPLWGVVYRDVAAYDLRLPLASVLALAAILGLVLAWTVNWFAMTFFGIQAKVRRG